MELLTALLVVLVVTAAMCGVTIWFLVHTLAVKNRVVPGQRSPAPLSWLVSVRFEATIHRRLRRAVFAAHAAVSGPAAANLGLVEIVGSLSTRAGELDAQLVIASHAPRSSRSRLVKELAAEAAEIEQLVERVIRMSRPASGLSERGLDAVRERLELLESALQELDGVDVRLLAGGGAESALRRHA